MTLLVVLSVLVIVLLIAGLAVYLYWAGTLLDRIGANLEGAAETVRGIVADAELIAPGVEHINQTGGVVAGALPLLYSMAEGIVTAVTPAAPRPPAGSGQQESPAGFGQQESPAGFGQRESPAGFGQQESNVPEPALPASGTRRSRLLESVGFMPR